MPDCVALVHIQQEFVCTARPDRQPVEVSEDEIRRDVRLQPHSGEKSGSSVLDALKAI